MAGRVAAGAAAALHPELLQPPLRDCFRVLDSTQDYVVGYT